MINDSLPETVCDRQFLWVATNPSLQCFDRRMLRAIGCEFPLKYWQYSQSPDEPASLDIALELLHSFIQTSKQPIHLIGHGLGGSLALSYAHHYPGNVASLALLSVAIQPSITWQTYYYHQLTNTMSHRSLVLQKVASEISRITCRQYVQNLASRLDRDLLEAPVTTSLFRQQYLLPQGIIPQPLLVCGAVDDPVLKDKIFDDWSHYLKPGDQIWHQPHGGHFFHHHYADQIGMKVRDYWRKLMPEVLQCVLPKSLGITI
jgi:pimeloyl-ACP methyl ester carboxylesterase